MENAKALVGLIVVLSSFFAPQVASAEENREWNFQLLANASGEVPVYRDDIAVMGSVNALWDVAGENVIGFLYFGGRFSMADWYTLHILLAATIDFPAEDVYGFDVSLWHSFRFFEGVLTLFIETDMIFHPEGFIYYGVYAADLHPLACLNIGFGAEQTDGTVVVGPRIGVSSRFFRVQLQYFANVIGGGIPNTIRLTIGLNF